MSPPDLSDVVAASGPWGRVEWATKADGHSPAREFFEALDRQGQGKALALFQRLADQGWMTNEQKFKKLGADLWEFKSGQIRFIGNYRPGQRFIVALGLRKKQDEHRPRDLDRARQILADCSQ